jgi:hypothetical protein
LQVIDTTNGESIAPRDFTDGFHTWESRNDRSNSDFGFKFSEAGPEAIVNAASECQVSI